MYFQLVDGEYLAQHDWLEAVELFDHKFDPQETKNVADDNPQVVKRLIKQMRAGWKAALQER